MAGYQRRKNIDPIQLPCKKRIYHSREEANDAIGFITEIRVTREIWAYQCPICGFWHLTSRTRK